MSEEELAISRSTPGCRFDAPACPAPAAAAVAKPAAPAPDATASEFVDQVLADATQPLMLFALEWCEFCWSVRKLFDAIGVSYRSVDLDSVEYQKDDFGGRIRAVLQDRTGSSTIPQVFVAGRHVGGATATFDAFRDGHLQRWLTEAGVPFRDSPGLDPYTMLPGWLHSR